ATWDGEDSEELYDLVVVGAGISGLAAAYFYQQAVGEGAKVLILDNHDDFGGHAKRNEFNIDGRLMVGYGGTQSIEAPSSYPDVAKQLVRDLGVDLNRFYQAFDRDLYKSLGLSRGIFFDKETFGADHLAVGELNNPQVLKTIPVSDSGKADIARLLADTDRHLSDVAVEDRVAYLNNIDYRSYLAKHAGMGDEALKIMQSRSRGLWAIGIDALPASVAWSSGYPGFADTDLGVPLYGGDEEPYIFHFPDGNASIARLLVRKMIPAVAAGEGMEDIVTAKFDYGQLDDPGSPVRIRLNGTADGYGILMTNCATPYR
ncbi:MAG: NAD(P)/FAD-dependent oxidoreductase, partial [Gammaproteobacteria bacterium]|nr:NAD(P)/FAD-dependent oxidoreductase [Gammaproteobacteria bacterium]